VPQQADAPLRQRRQAHQGLEQRGLARPVWPDQRGAPPTGKPKRYVGQRGLREAGIDHRHAFQRNGQLGL